MTPGSTVRISSKCTSNGRVGTTTETPLFWRLMGWHRVEFDAAPAWGIFPAGELVACERAQPAQTSLWGAL